MKAVVFRAKPMGILAFFFCLALMAVFFTIKSSDVKAVSGQKEKKCPIYSVETNDKKVSLGINCAWDNADIPQLLEILEKYRITATFFLVGDWCDAYPESVRLLHDAGHELGTHSDTHADMAKLDLDGIRRELRNSANKIEALTGKRPTLFRPPSGSYNTLVVETAEQEGFYPIQWDCDSIDYKNPTPQKMEERIMKKIRCGSILLFHSGAKNTPDALPQIIESIQAAGYQFVPVSQLIYPPPYTVDFEGRQHPAGA